MVYKKISILIPVLSILLGLSTYSCKTDIELTGDFEPYPVIFGLLDQNDSIHYIRINRTFTGNGNPSETGMIADSSYWNQVDAYVYEIEQTSEVAADTFRVWKLRDTIVDNKDTNGVFFAPEQKLYYFTSGPNSGNRLKDNLRYKYVLKASFNEGALEAQSIAELVKTDHPSNQALMSIQSPSTSNGTFNFATTPPNEIDYKSVQLQWSMGNADIFQVKLIFIYTEFTNTTSERKELVWNIGEYLRENTTGSTSFVNLDGESFYRYIGDNIQEDPNVTKRRFEGIRVDIVGGSEDLNKYIQVSEPTTSLSQTQPTFTNIDGAIGLFASRTLISNTWIAYNPSLQFLRALTPSSVRALCERSPYTNTLKFCSNHIVDAGELWYCP